MTDTGYARDMAQYVACLVNLIIFFRGTWRHPLLHDFPHPFTSPTYMKHEPEEEGIEDSICGLAYQKLLCKPPPGKFKDGLGLQ